MFKMPQNQNLDGSPGAPPAGMEQLSPGVLFLPAPSLLPGLSSFFLAMDSAISTLSPAPVLNPPQFPVPLQQSGL